MTKTASACGAQNTEGNPVYTRIGAHTSRNDGRNIGLSPLSADDDDVLRRQNT